MSQALMHTAASTPSLTPAGTARQPSQGPCPAARAHQAQCRHRSEAFSGRQPWSQPRSSRLDLLRCAAVATQALPVVSTEEEFKSALDGNDLLVVDFMARWCRKCIYLKPKLERMLGEDFPGLPVLFVDVNAVPSAVVYGAGIKKMPTIQLYKGGEKVAEHIAAEGAIDALEKIKRMIMDNSDRNGSS